MRTFHIRTAMVLVALLLAAPLPAAQMVLRGTAGEGRILFHSPALSSNGVSCYTCHSDFDPTRRKDGLIRAGHTMYNASGRKTFWGQEPDSPGRYANASQAAVVCVEHFMQSEDKLTAQQLLSLQAYLSQINRRPASAPLAIAPGADKTGAYSGFGGGDRIRGRGLFYAACHSCHPNGNTGISQVPLPRDKPPAFYARKIRESDGLGAVLSGMDPNAYDAQAGMFMPFFGVDRLDNDQVRDIIAFIKSLPAQK